MSIRGIDGRGVPPIQPLDKMVPEREPKRDEERPLPQPKKMDYINPELKDGQKRKRFLVKKKSRAYGPTGKAETEWKAFTEEEAKQAGLNWDDGRE